MNIWERLTGPSQKTIDRLEKKFRDDLETEQIEKEMADSLAREEEEQERIAKAKYQAEIDVAAARLNEDKMTSDEPWVEMTGSEVDDEKGIKVELNWNTAFINYLREGGIQGASEEECAQRWLAMVARDVDGRQADHNNDGKDDSKFE